MTESLRVSYDELPYDSRPIPASHIEVLAVEAALNGVAAAAPIERCRVLELGCASGGNLLPMADEFPKGEFVGLDLSPVQVEEGRRLAEGAGLGNAKLLAMDLMNVGPDLGQFDYIIAHGLYSWVPPVVQEKVLQIFAVHLAPAGIGYISYNTLPGWHNRRMVRDILLRHTRGARDSRDAVARARRLLGALVESDPGENNAPAALARAEARLQLSLGDMYIAHEPLAENLEAVYFETFVARLAQHGLAYLAECRPNPMRRRMAMELPARLPELAGDRLAIEQYTDFFLGTQFRRSAVVRANVPQQPGEHDPTWVERLHLRTLAKPRAAGGAIDLAPGVALAFVTNERGSLAFSDPVSKALMLTLSQRWPRAISFDEALAGVRGLVGLGQEFAAPGTPQRANLARAVMYYRDSGLIELRFPSQRFTDQPGPRPAASPLARAVAVAGATDWLPSRLHVAVNELTALEREVVRHLDGKCDLQELGRLIPDTTAESLAAAVKKLADHAFLIA
jgi:SAM-dependent methyltransferase